MYSQKQYTRSPAFPKSPALPSASQKPAFQPPSFYAAAANAPFSQNNRYLSETAGQQTYVAQNIPITYPTQSQSDSADQDGGPGNGPGPQNQRKRSNSITRSIARAMPRTHRQEKERDNKGKRKSQLDNIPLLETQLLPSLRDTIDRMTHPPQAANPEYGEESHELYITHNHNPLSLHETRQSIVPPSHLYRVRDPPTSTLQHVTAQPLMGIRPPTILPSPMITIEAPTPDAKATKSLRTTRIIPPGASPRSYQSGTSQSSQTKSPRPIHSPRPADPHEGANRSKIPQARPSRSNPGTPKSALKTPSSLATPKVVSPLQHASNASGPPIMTPSIGRREIEQRSELVTTGGKARAAGAAIPSSSSESGESELEREQWRHRRDVWNHVKVTDKRAGSHSQTPKTYHNIPGPSRVRSQLPSGTSASQQGAGVGLGLHLEQTYEVSPSIQRNYTRENSEHHSQVKHAREAHGATSRRDRTSLQRSASREDYRRREALLGLIDDLRLDPQPQALPLHNQSHYAAGHSKRDSSTATPDETVEGPANSSRRGIRLQRTSATDQRASKDFPQMRIAPNDEHHRSRHDRDARIHSQITDRSPRQQYQETSHEEQTYSKHTSRARNRRSSSVPSIAQPSRIASPLLLAPRVEKSVRFQPNNEVYFPQEEEQSKTRRTKHRASTSVDVTINKRRASKDVSMDPKHRRSSHMAQEQPSQQWRNSRDHNSLRERDGFGIPPSLSYTAYDERTHDQQDSDSAASFCEPEEGYTHINHLPHAESDLSSVDGGSWQPRADGDGFSRGAESLFHELSAGAPVHDGSSVQRHRRKAQSPKQSSGIPDFSSNARHEYQSLAINDSYITVSESPSTPSIYEDESFEQENPLPIAGHSDQRNVGLRAVMQPHAYDTLLARYGHLEMQRQDIIFDLSSSEAAFVRCLRATVRRFILPLRRRDSKAWILGVPEPVSRLFDWLEDIVNLHVGLGEALVACGEAWRAVEIVDKISETVRSFLPRFEVYQPYLIRVDHVTELIIQAMADDRDEFGEFIRLREQEAEREERTLAQLLQEPVKRLASYPAMFEKLLLCTPGTHHDYLPSVSLLHSTRIIISVLHEVKSREQRYEHAKELLSQIAGSTQSLIARERDLLWEGVVEIKAITLHRLRYSSRHGGTDGQRDPAEMAHIRILVFTDVVVLAAPDTRSKRSSRSSSGKWRVLENAGTSRILRLEESTEGRIVSLDLLIVLADELQTGVIPEHTSMQSIQLNIPASWTAESITEALTALRKCQAYAIRSLSFPSHSGRYLSHGLQVDLEQDIKQSVMAIISTGLPLPKSPSIQMAEASGGQRSDAVELEREERGWWSLRFQQVMREMQRQSVDQAMVSVSWLY